MKRILFALIFIISLAALIISLGLFANMGVFVDEYNLTPAIVCGGESWLLADWARLGLLLLVCVFSFIGMLAKDKKK